jgi:hypothetical protein
LARSPALTPVLPGSPRSSSFIQASQPTSQPSSGSAQARAHLSSPQSLTSGPRPSSPSLPRTRLGSES